MSSYLLLLLSKPLLLTTLTYVFSGEKLNLLKYDIKIFHRFFIYIRAFYIYKFLNSLNYSFHKLSLSENTLIISLDRWNELEAISLLC